jgi:hypothetical protein
VGAATHVARSLAVNYLEHPLAALTIQLLIRQLDGSWWLGAAIGSSYFLGREIAQAEYRWIEQFGQGLRANMPWWAAFDLRVWPKLDQWMDWIGPLTTTCALALIMQEWERLR